MGTKGTLLKTAQIGEMCWSEPIIVGMANGVLNRFVLCHPLCHSMLRVETVMLYFHQEYTSKSEF